MDPLYHSALGFYVWFGASRHRWMSFGHECHPKEVMMPGVPMCVIRCDFACAVIQWQPVVGRRATQPAHA
eukprot:3768726-Alexandrium_andersonii.AAC.1